MASIHRPYHLEHPPEHCPMGCKPEGKEHRFGLVCAESYTRAWWRCNRCRMTFPVEVQSVQVTIRKTFSRTILAKMPHGPHVFGSGLPVESAAA